MNEPDSFSWRVIQAGFIKSAQKPEQFPEALPSVAFAGRSNVGKSSLMNRLMGRKRLAKTSSTPGCTQLVNFFDINGQYHFIDLPGYGYAKMPRPQRQLLGRMLRRFFEKVEGLRLTVVLLDARRTPGVEDLKLIEWLNETEQPYVFAVTKCDKLGTNALAQTLAKMRKQLGVGAEHLIPVSSLSGRGVDDLLGVIGSVLMDEMDEDEGEVEQ